MLPEPEVEPQSSEYAVEIDHAWLVRSRATILRAHRVGAWVTVSGGVLIVVLPLVAVFGLGLPFATVYPLLLSSVSGALLIVAGRSQFLEVRRRRATWEASGLPPVAIRMSAEGVWCATNSLLGPFLVPWSALAGVRVVRRFGRAALVLDLAAGVTATSPGVVVELPTGARERRAKARMFRAKGMLGIPEEALRSPISDIDQAFARFTEGRLRVR
ncbi:hypothetical protein OG948_37875 (plasmid) [Embleya sp. NBC_00888]|uniref:hypothetical protein n=1 Tax=Embleya sp. NBC_00888 TaxID=2975960 RepID=UPI00386BF714|nr:hypothetical protein OG948_37875 [Embleya sp. NBC_00888]